KGGAMNAVKACKEQKKKVFALRPTWDCDKSGGEKALKDGAVPVEAGPELASVLEQQVPNL
ncbi:MAG: hypothetical protein QGD94_00130, partial [Planctomycetia bacterium]|nr:hypothetical protein [Planctomycetia bacterium]